MQQSVDGCRPPCDDRWWEFLQAQMATRAMSQSAFAAFLGIPRSKLMAWRSGSKPAPDSITHLAPRLGVSVPTLLVEAGHFTAEELAPRDAEQEGVP